MKNVMIAHGITVGDWLRLDLSDNTYGEPWAEAIRILELRIEGRFLEPIRQLLKSEEDRPPKDRKYGFSIMAILCLLIETLQSFIEGKGHTQGKSKEMFIRFFTEDEPFKTKMKVTPEVATKIFYEIRCGILHQAEITGGSRLRCVGPTIKEVNGKLIINRTKFANGVGQAFELYVRSLREDTERGRMLRSNLEKKFAQVVANCG
jgi:hypothetical protein